MNIVKINDPKITIRPEIFEDYILDEKIKNFANKTLNIFAIIIPLFAIVIIFNLTL